MDIERRCEVAPGVSLHYERAGSGPPLLSISGSGTSLSDGLGPANLPLSAQFDVVGYDHRGLGRSLCADRPVTMQDFATDALRLADHLGWEQFAVLGLSFGGMVAQLLASEVPERVTSLVLGCTSPGGAGGSSYPLHERPGPDVLLRLIDSRPDHALVLVRAMGVRTPPAEPGHTRQLEARQHHDAWERLPSITARTLVASGRYDLIAPPENGERMAARIPGATYQGFDGGHGFIVQDPTAWPAITGFLTTELPDPSRTPGSVSPRTP
jgi:3-oxoadipate enol-lactonase